SHRMRWSRVSMYCSVAKIEPVPAKPFDSVIRSASEKSRIIEKWRGLLSGRSTQVAPCHTPRGMAKARARGAWPRATVGPTSDRRKRARPKNAAGDGVTSAVARRSTTPLAARALGARGRRSGLGSPSEDDQLGAAVLRAAVGRVVARDRLALALADRLEPARRDAAVDQVAAHGVGATLRQPQVVLLRADRVG